MIKFKIGDKVLVKSKKWFKENCIQLSNMRKVFLVYKDSYVGMVTRKLKYCEKIVTIDKVNGSSYEIIEDMHEFTWCDWMLEDKTWIRYQKLRKLYEV